MGLRGVKPTEVNKRLKFFMFGPAGSRKTTTALQFPRPYLIDTEKGAENESYTKLLNEAGGAYFFTASFDDVIEEVRSLLSEKHAFRTLIIDPFTVIYNEEVDAAALTEGTEFGRHRAVADRKIRRLLNLLLRLDMNVVITSHQKPKWERMMINGKQEVKEVGSTFDCYPKIDYLFDLVLEVQFRGKDAVAIVNKTRLTSFEHGDAFPLSYGEIATRYGVETLERDAVPVELATPQQVQKIVHLISVLQIAEDVQNKWLNKAQADSFDELPKAAAEKVIEWLNAKLEPGNEPEKEAK